MRSGRRSRRSTERSLWIRAGLALVDATRGPQRLLGIDPKVFRNLMALRLTLDRRPRKEGGKAESPFAGGIVPLTVMCLVMGAIFAFVGTLKETPYLIGVLISGSLLVYGCVSMVSLFADLLFDRPILTLMAARPVDDRTAFVARVAPIAVYVALIECALALPQVLVGTLRFGVWPFLPAASLVAVFAGLLAATLMLFVLALALRFTSIGRFKRILLRLQVVVTVAFIALPQLFSLAKGRGGGSALSDIAPGRWLLMLPPAWFGDLLETTCAVASGGSTASADVWIGSLLAVGLPVALMLIALRLTRGRFVAAMSAPEESAGWERAPTRGIVVRLGKRLSRTRLERAGYDLSAAITLRERAALMRVLPLLVMGPLLAVGTVPSLRVDPGLFLFLVVYGLAFAAAPLVLNLRYSEDAAAAWIMDAAPVSDAGSLVTGALRATIARFVLVPAASIALIAGLLAGPGAVIDCASAAAVTVSIMLVAAVFVGPRRPHSNPFVTKESQRASLLQAGLIPIIVFVAMLHSWARETVVGQGSFAAVVCGAAFMASRAHARALAVKDGSRSAE